MIAPPRKNVASADDWKAVCSDLGWTSGRALLVVHTPSATEYVHRNFGWAGVRAHLVIREEPQPQHLELLEKHAFDEAPFVVGIGGGKALDAAKGAAMWGADFRSVEEMTRLLESGGRVQHSRPSTLVLAPSIASSGSEASRGAIFTVGTKKMGLRGDSLLPDLVVHDAGLWSSLSREGTLHHAFDIFAHLIETTISLRRTPQALEHAGLGLDVLGEWIVRRDAAIADYQFAMDASYHAGVCLGSSSTCLPHRMQYVLGPATHTTHVEGIWFLARSWHALTRERSETRLKEFEGMLRPEVWGGADSGKILARLHEMAAAKVRLERFAILKGREAELAKMVDGDLSADPSYRDVSDIQALMTHD